LPCERRFLAYSLYQREAIAETCAAFAGHVSVTRTPRDATGEEVCVTPGQDALPGTCEEFFSYLLSGACERHLLEIAVP
jgi:hypothetical protein